MTSHTVNQVGWLVKISDQYNNLRIKNEIIAVKAKNYEKYK